MQFVDVNPHEDIRQLVRQFGEKEIRPVLEKYEKEEELPMDLVRKMGDLGFFGIIVPEEYGGIGLDYWAYAAYLEEFGRYGSLRATATAQQSLVCTPLLSFGSAAQKERYLPQLASGAILGSYCLTEPSSGSDAGSLQTRAVRDGDGWRLNGQKIFITNACHADLFIIFARTAPSDQQSRAITAFLVERKDGIRTTPLKGKLGLRASDTGTVFIEDVWVPDENRLGEIGEGFKIALYTLDNGRISLAAAAVGTSQTCVDLTTAYVQEREQFGKPIGSFQLIQDMLADMVVETEASRLLTYKAISAKYSGERFTKPASMAKYYATETANRNAERAIQCHGGYGFFEEYEVARLYRDARVYTIYEGTSQVQKLVISAQQTGLKAFI
ncbi:MAG: acyl-CoA dehydrogenase family protein [Anaerolineales bacterium]|nr:acyl-CoA dehydrogenase family protein [Anaerolineales bacterium]MCB0016241.1 acyl-CoA dehydrogenase family protein [Anaerolineales bacterium]